MIAGLIALITAFVIDFALGDPPNRFHPVAAMGSLIRALTQRWNRGGNFQRFFAGTCLVLIGGALFSAPWVLLASVIKAQLPEWAIGLLLGLCLKPVFAFRGLLRAGREVQQALLRDNLPAARHFVSWHLVSRDTSQLSKALVASATIESLSENLTDSFFAPLFYFALGGLPFAWFYRFINTADAMIGYHSPDYEHFGKFAARSDDLLNWLPARMTALLIILSAALCRLNPKNAFLVMKDQHKRTSSPNAGWTMSAAAGALAIALEKPGSYRLEGGPKLPDANIISKALRLITISLLISLFFCGGLIIGRSFFF